MSADAATADERTFAELLAMDEATAKRELTYAEYQRWESANDHHDQYQEAKQEWAENAAEATDILINADRRDLAAAVSIFGNDLLVYHSEDDPRIRETAGALEEAIDADLPSDDADAADLSVDDLDTDALAEVRSLLAELVLVSVVEWNGHAWDELSAAGREQIRTQIEAEPPGGWGAAGLADAWIEISTAIEQNRDERMERIQKFRSPERRGDR